MSATRTIAWGLTLVLLAAACVVQVKAGNAGDKNWLLLAARMSLQGKVLYRDIFEVNPPLIIWLYCLPVWVSLHLPIEDYRALGVMGLLFSGVSAGLSLLLIQRHPAFQGQKQKQAIFSTLLLSLFVFFTTQVYFFDRDDVMFICIFPYILRFMPALARTSLPLPLRIAIALLAVVGFSIKPYTLVIFAVLQLLYLLRERSAAILTSLENLILYAGVAFYLFCIWQFAPDYLRVVLPMAMATYSGFERRINGALFLSIAFLSAGLTFVEFRTWQHTPYRRDAIYFIGVALSFLAYALFNNGWGYTYNPLLCTLIFLSAWMLWDYDWLKVKAKAESQPVRPFVSGIAGCVANIALNTLYMIVCLGVFFFNTGCKDYLECHQELQYISYVREHQIHSFGALSMNLRVWTMLARSASWDTRFNHFWMLPKLLSEGPEFTGEHRWIVDYLGQGLADDLNQRKPQVVFVDANDAMPGGRPGFIDFIGFFSQVPEFKEAWKQYHYIKTFDQCDIELDPQKKTEPVAQQPTNCRFALYGRNDGAPLP